MVDFGGWEMPLQYPTGVLAEHHAVRRAAGLFDVSHMGEIRVRGPQAIPFLDWLTPNGVKELPQGRIHYTALLTEEGTFVDDILLHKCGDHEALLVVNASNTERDLAWVRGHAVGWELEILDESAATGQLALQGPRGASILQPLVDADLGDLRYYRFVQSRFRGIPVMIARTGYTGEDGFEIYACAADTPRLWEILLEAGRPQGLIPAGLASRNTLRLEAAMTLYGHEIDGSISVLEAGLGRILRFGKGDFLGREALLAQRERGVERVLAGFRMLEKGDIARDYMPVLEGGQVTSAAPSPTLGCSIGLALLPVGLSAPGTRVRIGIRGRACPAEVVPTPFLPR